MAASPTLLEEVHPLLPVTRAPQPQVTRPLAEPDLAVEAGERERVRRQADLVRTNLPFVWRFLRRLGLSPEDADDAAQEVFLVAVRKMDLIEDGRERRFLFGIAVRIASRARRSQKSRADKTVGAVDVDECRSPDLSSDEVLARKEARVLLDQALSEMKPDLRTAFVLYELEEMTMVEIATVTEAPLGTVASRLRRAREQFQEAAKRLQPSRQP